MNTPPKEVALTYSEAVEPRFAIVSVTDPAAHQETTGPPRRSPNDPDTLLVPLRHVGEGWYLVYWRAISVDGHPVRGAFTFAVGPNPGPAPQFVIPSIFGDCRYSQAADRALARLSLGHGSCRACHASARDGATGDPSCPGCHAAGRHGRLCDRCSARPRLDPDLRHAGNRRLRPSFVLLVRCVDSTRARVVVRARLHRSVDLLRAVRRCRGRSDSDRPSRARAALGRRALGDRRRRPRGRGRYSSCPAWPVTPRRPRRGDSRCSSTGCTSRPARSGSGASSDCSCCGGISTERRASPAWWSSCRDSRTPHSCP